MNSADRTGISIIGNVNDVESISADFPITGSETRLKSPVQTPTFTPAVKVVDFTAKNIPSGNIRLMLGVIYNDVWDTSQCFVITTKGLEHIQWNADWTQATKLATVQYDPAWIVHEAHEYRLRVAVPNKDQINVRIWRLDEPSSLVAEATMSVTDVFNANQKVDRLYVSGQVAFDMNLFWKMDSSYVLPTEVVYTGMSVVDV